MTSAEPQFLRDLTPRTRRERVSPVLRAAVDSLDGPPPPAEVVESFKAQHPAPVPRKREVKPPLYITVDGVSKLPSQWGVAKGLGPFLVRDRLKSGWHQRAAVLGRKGESKSDAHARLKLTPNRRPRRVGGFATRSEPSHQSIPNKTSHEAEYHAWKGAQHRCTSPKNASWRYFGALGIKFHDGWKGPGGFARFMAEVGERPGDEYALCRKRKNENYEPGNVEWRLKSNVKVGVKSDRELYDAALPTRVTYVHGTRADCAAVVQVFECGGILTVRELERFADEPSELALVNRSRLIGDLRISGRQADELALALVRMGYGAYETQRRHDSKGVRK